MSALVYKTTYNGNDDQLPALETPLFSEDQIDTIVEAMAGLRHEFRQMLDAERTRFERSVAELRDANSLRSEVAELRGAITTLLNNSAGGDKSVELSATKVIRKVTTRKS